MKNRMDHIIIDKSVMSITLLCIFAWKHYLLPGKETAAVQLRSKGLGCCPTSGFVKIRKPVQVYTACQRASLKVVLRGDRVIQYKSVRSKV